jgi:hypothetical protein
VEFGNKSVASCHKFNLKYIDLKFGFKFVFPEEASRTETNLLRRSGSPDVSGLPEGLLLPTGDAVSSKNYHLIFGTNFKIQAKVCFSIEKCNVMMTD